MSIQTTYDTSLAVAVDGLIVAGNDVETMIVETAAGIAPGKVVSRGTGDHGCVIGGDGTGVGVVGRDLSKEGAVTTNELTYAQYDDCPVVRDGYVWAPVSDIASRGSVLNYVDATGVIGAGAAGGGETDLTGWTLETDVASGGDLGLIRVKN